MYLSYTSRMIECHQDGFAQGISIKVAHDGATSTAWRQVTPSSKMHIRKTQPQDLGAVLNIYQQARIFMRETGNPSQWADSWPPSTLIEEDIIQQKSYVCVKSPSESPTVAKTEQVMAVFFLETADDPSYHQIQGQWLEPHQPYGVIHRLASSRRIQGAATLCLQWALEQCGNIRIDTHQANLPMRNLLQKLDYHYCGIIHTHDGTARLAYQKVTKKS